MVVNMSGCKTSSLQLESLPEDALLHVVILGNMHLEEVLSLSRTGRTFAKLCRTKELWIQLVRRDFGTDARPPEQSPTWREWRRFYAHETKLGVSRPLLDEADEVLPKKPNGKRYGFAGSLRYLLPKQRQRALHTKPTDFSAVLLTLSKSIKLKSIEVQISASSWGDMVKYTRRDGYKIKGDFYYQCRDGLGYYWIKKKMFKQKRIVSSEDAERLKAIYGLFLEVRDWLFKSVCPRKRIYELRVRSAKIPGKLLITGPR